MTDQLDIENLPQATLAPRKRLHVSVVWIIPLLAALVGLSIALQKILSEGPTITIVFKNAEGIEAGKTFVKYKNVNIGQVTQVQLSENFSKVVVTAKIDKSAAGLLVEDAKFWVEQPRVTLSGISGIGTLLSGNYIGLEVGKSKNIRREFTGFDDPPTVTVDQPGREFILQADNLGSLGIGSPVYYRRLNVGQVIGYDLAKNGKAVTIKTFVKEPYDRYVTAGSRFWQASGIDMSMSESGLSVRTQSVLSLLIGGIAFETPASAVDLQPAAPDTVFALHDDKMAAMAQQDEFIASYVVYFNESLRGLAVGAPVTYLGLPTGEVTSVSLEYNEVTKNVRPRVDIALYPARFLGYMKKTASAAQMLRTKQGRDAFLQRLIDQGFRAQLKRGNLVTGLLYVALEFFPNAPPLKVDFTKDTTEIPVMPSVLQDLETRVNSILNKMDNVTVQEMETRINSILNKMDKLPIDAIGADVRKGLATLDRLLQHLDREGLPALQTTLTDLQRVLKNADATLVGKDAPAQYDLRETLRDISRAAQEIRNLAEYLERHPDALIRGKTQEQER